MPREHRASVVLACNNLISSHPLCQVVLEPTSPLSRQPPDFRDLADFRPRGSFPPTFRPVGEKNLPFPKAAPLMSPWRIVEIPRPEAKFLCERVSNPEPPSPLRGEGWEGGRRGWFSCPLNAKYFCVRELKNSLLPAVEQSRRPQMAPYFVTGFKFFPGEPNIGGRKIFFQLSHGSRPVDDGGNPRGVQYPG